MTKSLALIILLVLFNCHIGISQNTDLDLENPLGFTQLKLDTLFDSKQIISILNISLDKYSLEFVYNELESQTTSTLANETDAIGAINAGFFDMKIGGSVTYFEVNDSLISYTGGKNREEPITESIINGALIITKSNQLKFEYKRPDSIYLKSLNENAVLATGPILVQNGENVTLADIGFVNKRHPRTCLCLTENELLIITVDGRSDQAQGMSLHELQEFLQLRNCQEAINLDGGGSTTMWLRNKGVVNNPSDRTGERKVANVIIIKQNLN